MTTPTNLISIKADAKQTASCQARLFDTHDLSYALGGRVLLNRVSLSVEARKVTGLIGHNGSGKSTLLKLMARMMQPSEGTIRFEGKNAADWRLRDYARKVGYLAQHPPHAGGMLVRELVAFGRYPWHGALGRFSDTDRRKVHEAMRLTDVERFSDRFVDTLSGGERQRVWLAMLVAQDAECLLLDEPTSALDLAHQIEVLSLIKRLCSERSLGVVVVLHDINMAARFCDDIVALHTGRLIARGSPEHIMQPDVLESIYGIPIGVLPHPGRPNSLCYAQ